VAFKLFLRNCGTFYESTENSPNLAADDRLFRTCADRAGVAGRLHLDGFASVKGESGDPFPKAAALATVQKHPVCFSLIPLKCRGGKL